MSAVDDSKPGDNLMRSASNETGDSMATVSALARLKSSHFGVGELLKLTDDLNLNDDDDDDDDDEGKHYEGRYFNTSKGGLRDRVAAGIEPVAKCTKFSSRGGPIRKHTPQVANTNRPPVGAETTRQQQSRNSIGGLITLASNIDNNNQIMLASAPDKQQQHEQQALNQASFNQNQDLHLSNSGVSAGQQVQHQSFYGPSAGYQLLEVQPQQHQQPVQLNRDQHGYSQHGYVDQMQPVEFDSSYFMSHDFGLGNHERSFARLEYHELGVPNAELALDQTNNQTLYQSLGAPDTESRLFMGQQQQQQPMNNFCPCPIYQNSSQTMASQHSSEQLHNSGGQPLPETVMRANGDLAPLEESSRIRFGCDLYYQSSNSSMSLGQQRQPVQNKLTSSNSNSNLFISSMSTGSMQSLAGEQHIRRPVQSEQQQQQQQYQLASQEYQDYSKSQLTNDESFSVTSAHSGLSLGAGFASNSVELEQPLVGCVLADGRQVNSPSGNYQLQGNQNDEAELKVCEWDGCDNTFLSMAEFVKHLEDKHVNQEPREKNRYFCLWTNCKRNEQEFNARYKLLIHMRVHSGEKPYPCTNEDCKKSFSRLENLKIHVRSHTGEKPYKCNVDTCNKSFTNSSDRIKHHKTHKDPKPYSCTHSNCKKRYTDPSSLRKHLRAHKRAKPATADGLASEPSSAIQHQQQPQQRLYFEQIPTISVTAANCVPDDFDPAAILADTNFAASSGQRHYDNGGRQMGATRHPADYHQPGGQQQQSQLSSWVSEWPVGQQSYQTSEQLASQRHSQLSRSWCAGSSRPRLAPRPANFGTQLGPCQTHQSPSRWPQANSAHEQHQPNRLSVTHGQLMHSMPMGGFRAPTSHAFSSRLSNESEG